ncbi:MAG: sarcosine oxidase subunit gamma [Alphaproteobacteria bacterium]
MMDSPQIQTISPLVDKKPLTDDKIAIAEVPMRGKITLRGDQQDAAFQKAIKKTTKLALPLAQFESHHKDQLSLYKLTPDEWMIFCALDQLLPLMAALEDALQSVHHALVDVSDYYTEINLKGANTLNMLAAGIVLNLNESEFPIGMACYTDWHLANILLMRNDQDDFTAMVRWSMAPYLYDYFTQSAKAI